MSHEHDTPPADHSTTCSSTSRRRRRIGLSLLLLTIGAICLGVMIHKVSDLHFSDLHSLVSTLPPRPSIRYLPTYVVLTYIHT